MTNLPQEHPQLPDFQPLDSLKLYLNSEHIQ